MLRVGDNSPVERAAPSASTATPAAAQTAESRRTLPSAPAPSNSSSDAFLGSGFSRYDLLALNAGVDDASRKINALSTASDAIGVIGGLLNNIQGSLASTGSAANADAEQSRVDGAIVTIDAIANSTRFAGRNLLDGSFTLASSQGSVAIPSFRTASLGRAVESDASESSLASLGSDGVNALASGNHTHAAGIVRTALSQVAGMQAQINGLVSAMTSDRGAHMPTNDSAASAARSPLSTDPATASRATANSSAQRVLALLAF